MRDHHIRRCRGFTLVEIMVALTISLILLGGVIQLYLSHSDTYRNQEALSRLQENARFALSSLVEAVARGGHMGCLSDSAEVTNVLSKKGEVEYDFGNAVGGADDAADGFERDTLRVRSAAVGADNPALQVVAAPAGQEPTPDDMAQGTAPIWLDPDAFGYDELEQFDVLVLADCEAVAVFMVSNDPGASGGKILHDTGAADADGLENSDDALGHGFGMATGSVATAVVAETSEFDIRDNVQGVPSLYLNGEEVVEGVLAMQVLYGANVAGNVRYVDATELDGAGAPEWVDVVSVRVTLTVSSVQNFAAGQPLTKDVTTTIQLRNRSV